MLTPNECRAKAREAYALSASATTDAVKEEWLRTAKTWEALAVTSETQAAIMRSLDPNYPL
jgi:hypothetical protein